MAAKPDNAATIARKIGLIHTRLEGCSSASSSALSASYGLPVERVRNILRSRGVRDDG